MTEPLTYPPQSRRAYFGTRGARETRDRLNAGTIISAQVCAWWRRCNRGAETSQTTYGTHDGGPESSPTGAQDLWLGADQRTLERQLLYDRVFSAVGQSADSTTNTVGQSSKVETTDHSLGARDIAMAGRFYPRYNLL